MPIGMSCGVLRPLTRPKGTGRAYGAGLARTSACSGALRLSDGSGPSTSRSGIDITEAYRERCCCVDPASTFSVERRLDSTARIRTVCFRTKTYLRDVRESREDARLVLRSSTLFFQTDKVASIGSKPASEGLRVFRTGSFHYAVVPRGGYRRGHYRLTLDRDPGHHSPARHTFQPWTYADLDQRRVRVRHHHDQP